MRQASFSLKQDKVTVASGSGPAHLVINEALHYASMYAQDGPVVLRISIPQTAPPQRQDMEGR